MREAVEEYYGSVLESSGDLKTNACSTAGAPPSYMKLLLDNVHRDITSTYYGCGLVYPSDLRGARVLDLGCGTGRDCYVLSQLVGEHGIKSWAAIATRLRDRNGKQCRERWRNHLRPQLFKGEWTPEEDQKLPPPRFVVCPLVEKPEPVPHPVGGAVGDGELDAGGAASLLGDSREDVGVGLDAQAGPIEHALKVPSV